MSGVCTTVLKSIHTAQCLTRSTQTFRICVAEHKNYNKAESQYLFKLSYRLLNGVSIDEGTYEYSLSYEAFDHNLPQMIIVDLYKISSKFLCRLLTFDILVSKLY